MATIVDGKKRIPFLRGMLAHYLIEHGFAFQDAYTLADNVRRALQKAKDIKAKDMADLVRDQVQREFGDRNIGDVIFWEPTSRQIFIEEGEKRTVFSLERLADSFTATGLDHDLAHKIAGLIEQEIAEINGRVVKLRKLFKTTLAVLEAECGPEFAARYQAWYQFRKNLLNKPLIILIGGASGVGKTSAGLSLANHLKISRVASTDAIRQIMRLMIAPDLMPTLHVSSFAAWKHAGAEFSQEKAPVILAFREQAARVCVGARAIIDRTIEENASIVIDGVHLLPDLVDLSDYEDQAIFIWANLYIDDKDRYAQRFTVRSKKASLRASHHYIENLDAILEIQQHILDVGEAHQIIMIENTDFDEAVQSLLTHIMDVLRKVYKIKPSG